MRANILLQEHFLYLLILLIIAIGLIVGFAIYLIHAKKTRKKIREEMERIKVIPEKNIKNIPVIKNKYLEELNDIENKYKRDKINIRKAYQLISEAMKLFVFEVTDITIQNYSLTEINNLEQYELIKEYYEPEFEYKMIEYFESSIDKAKNIINEWK